MSRPEPVFVCVSNLPATKGDQQSVLKTRGLVLVFQNYKKVEDSATQLGVPENSRELDGYGYHKGRLWSPGAGLATLGGLQLPSTRASSLPAHGAKGLGMPALCSLPAQWTKTLSTLSLSTSPRPCVALLCRLGKGRKDAGLQGGKEGLRSSRKRRTTYWGCYVICCSSQPLHILV